MLLQKFIAVWTKQTIKSYLFFEKLQNERLKKTLKGSVKAKRITKTKYLHSTLENEKKNCSERLFYQYFVENQFFGLARSHIANSASVHAHTFRLAAEARIKLKAKIEIMNKLLWITTLPNTSPAEIRRREKMPIPKLLMIIIWFWLCCLQTQRNGCF